MKDVVFFLVCTGLGWAFGYWLAGTHARKRKRANDAAAKTFLRTYEAAHRAERYRTALRTPTGDEAARPTVGKLGGAFKGEQLDRADGDA